MARGGDPSEEEDALSAAAEDVLQALMPESAELSSALATAASSLSLPDLLVEAVMTNGMKTEASGEGADDGLGRATTTWRSSCGGEKATDEEKQAKLRRLVGYLLLILHRNGMLAQKEPEARPEEAVPPPVVPKAEPVDEDEVPLSDRLPRAVTPKVPLCSPTAVTVNVDALTKCAHQEEAIADALLAAHQGRVTSITYLDCGDARALPGVGQVLLYAASRHLTELQLFDPPLKLLALLREMPTLESLIVEMGRYYEAHDATADLPLGLHRLDVGRASVRHLQDSVRMPNLRALAVYRDAKESVDVLLPGGREQQRDDADSHGQGGAKRPRLEEQVSSRVERLSVEVPDAATVRALVDAHAPTLKELIVFCATHPMPRYGCWFLPNLASGLAAVKPKLEKLEKIVLHREMRVTLHGTRRLLHESKDCLVQLAAVKRVLPRVELQCSVCNRYNP